MIMDFYENLRKLNLEIPPPPEKGGIYSKMIKVGPSLYFTSGVGCKRDGDFLYIGQTGGDVTIEQAQEAACQSILNHLSNMEQELGDLNKIKQIVKITGFVSSIDGFKNQPLVMDAASSLLVDIFGPISGSCARTAVGVNALPGNQVVEIEMIFEVLAN